MPENVSVDEALRKGRMRLTILPIVAFILIMVLFPLLVGATSARWVVSVITVVLVCVVYYWRMLWADEWYAWALERVRNVHELRQRAILKHFITESKAPPAHLAHKFDVPDEFTDDPDMPVVSRIYLIKRRDIFMIIIMVVCFVAGITLMVAAHLLAVGGIVCAVSAYLIFDSGRRLMDNEPQITISNEGMGIAEGNFHRWKDIKNELVGEESAGKGTIYYLTFDANGEKEQIYLYGLNINRWKLAKMLSVYRGRNNF